MVCMVESHGTFDELSQFIAVSVSTNTCAGQHRQGCRSLSAPQMASMVESHGTLDELSQFNAASVSTNTCAGQRRQECRSLGASLTGLHSRPLAAH